MRHKLIKQGQWALLKKRNWVPIILPKVGGYKMKRWFMGGILITAVIGLFFMAGNTYPAISTYNLEESTSITDNKTEEMIHQLTGNKTERGMTGKLTADLDKALWFSSNKEQIKTKGEVFEDITGYSEIRDLKSMIQEKRAVSLPLPTVVSPAKALMFSRPTTEELKKEIARRGLEKKGITENGVREPFFSILRNPEREEVSVPVGEDSALPYTSTLLVSMIMGTIISFMLTCTWGTWSIPAPGVDVENRADNEEEMPLAA